MPVHFRRRSLALILTAGLLAGLIPQAAMAAAPSLATATIASGLVIPWDALSGGALAGRNGVPMLLSAPGEVPLHTGQEILRLSPRQLTMLGGASALNGAVEARLKRLVATP